MNRALIVKELRESAGLVAVAALVAAWVLCNLRGVAIPPFNSREAVDFPFVTDQMFYTAIAIVGGGLGGILALKQSAWEEMKGTFRYLLYRPIERRRVMLMKMAVGLTVTMVLMAVFILLHAAWAAGPGRHPSPFYWSMTVPAWHHWFVLPVFYMGTLLTGIRPARWWGSRVFPAAAAGMAGFMLIAQPWWWVALVGSALVTLLLAFCVLNVARVRDY
jgi:hypothetical protein